MKICIRWGLYHSVVFTILCGCAAVPPAGKVEPAAVAPAISAAGIPQWWYARIEMGWPQDADPAWHLDTLIAGEILGPVLEQYHERIPLWRFHRRATRDGAGHQFSLIYYTDPDTGREIARQLQEHELLQGLAERGLIRKLSIDKPGPGSRGGIADASDSAWPESLQAAWPHYLMGASRLWLSLIAHARKNHHPSDRSIDGLIEAYMQVNDAVSAVWREFGQHAFFHHLNALFGYEPLEIQTELRF